MRSMDLLSAPRCWVFILGGVEPCSGLSFLFSEFILKRQTKNLPAARGSPRFFCFFLFAFFSPSQQESSHHVCQRKNVYPVPPHALFLFLRPTRLETLHAAPTHPCRVPKSSRAAATMFLLTTICGDLLGEGSKEAGSYRAGKWKPHIEYNAAPCVTSTHARAYYGSATSPLGIFGNSGGPLNTMAWGMPGGHRVVEEHRPPRRGP